MAEPDQELYEELELADDAVEDIYEDLPDSAFNDAPISPPPLPSTPIPSFPSPAHKAPPLPPSNVPPIPTRAMATSLTRNQPSNNLQKPIKQTKATTMKPGKPGKPPPAVKAKAGGGGGGIDISEIMKRARQRTGSTSAIMDLETKIGEKKDDDNAHVAPWANQLRKPKVPPPPKEARKEGGEGSTPPWVKRKVENEEPATESRARAPPTAPSKPPVANGSGPDGRSSPTGDDNKPPWLKQRERQQQLAKTAPGSGIAEKPHIVPKPAAKPPPMAPKPATKPPQLAPGPKPPSDQPPPTSPRKTRPVPTPKTNDSAESEKQASGASPPTQSAGVLAKAKMFAEAGSKPAIAPKTGTRPPPVKPHGVGAENSPVVAPRVEKKSPTPPPIPTRESSMSQSTQPRSPSPIPEDTPPFSRPPPSVPETNAAPIPAFCPPPISTRPPPPPTTPPPPSSQPPIIPPPPPLSEPPGPPSLPDRNPPKAPPPFLPSSRPPPSLPATRAQPTPPTGSVMKFRRRPLKSVDRSKPPPLPPPNSKPVKFPIQPPLSSVPPPAPSGGVSAGSWAETSGDGDEPEDIYEDTAAGAPEEDGPDELYDDIGNIQASKPPMPPLPSSPPLLPSVPPPTFRPPPPMVVETPEINYEMDPNLQQNGVVHEDVTQELYEDLNPIDGHLNSPGAPSVTTLPLPLSSSQNSLTPSTSPTLDRKQKLSREQKKQQKEEERKKKELKKKEEAKAKNRLKSLKTFKEFKLPNDVQSLFAVEVQEDHPKTKDHMAVSKGEQVYVLLISHPKLPNDRYFIEKDDGTMGFVMKSICVRVSPTESLYDTHIDSLYSTTCGYR
ncbi:Filamentous hemagglutinin [Geodia barretti]|uniref:Filamentous hemagglutinin n=1 Tax=Geodia barretti TaxID=519541 RepID=A0AA35TWG8_GEOBA|nr:Filamentous hemagglutinin [Geodia barretti]